MGGKYMLCDINHMHKLDCRHLPKSSSTYSGTHLSEFLTLGTTVILCHITM